MKQKHFLRIALTLALFFFTNLNLKAQLNTGSIAFTAVNTDGEKDFSIVVLTDIPANSSIYITDNEPNGNGGFTSGEGAILWDTGGTIITKGTIIVFTDVNNDATRTVTNGSITEPDAGFNPAGEEALFAYLGTSASTPSTFLGGIQIGTQTTSTVAGDLTGTGLTLGTTFIKVGTTLSPDGIFYDIGSRTNQESFSEYLTLLGNAANWSQNTANGELTLPISTTAFSLTATTTTTWTGGTSNWETPGNWNNGLPDATMTAIVANVGTAPIISSGTTALAKNLTINSGASLTINAGNSLTVDGDLTNYGALTINSDATGSGSLLTNGFNYGELTYNRYLVGADWHLVSSPIKEQDIYTFTVTNDATNDVTKSGSNNYGMAPYNNNAAGASTAWNYYNTTNLTSTGTKFLSSKGYSALRDATGTFSFQGKMLTGNTTFPITVGTYNSWNLIGNGYPSFLLASNFITTNTALINASFQAVYVWDNTLNAGAGGYDAITGTHYIHPGQAFFVNSAAGGGNISFTTSMLSHQTGAGFLKSTNSEFSIKLYIKRDSNSKFTKINFKDNATKGLDPGEDIGQFGGVTNSFNIYTHLIEQNEGINFMIQSLPNSGYENMIIPIGVKASNGKEIAFTTETLNLPTGIKVYIEDKENNTFTRLDEVNSEYKVTLNKDINGIGRFYIHTAANALNINSENLDNVTVYKSNASTLRIIGLIKGNNNIKLFNTFGKQVMDLSFQSNGIKDISLPKLASGVYIVQLKTDTGKLSKKIILE